ncbi:MAG: DoxX family membrane protein [Chloroflexia bacterium]|nr:DoxX family membrane protein [Chloroflexia bacterium]
MQPMTSPKPISGRPPDAARWVDPVLFGRGMAVIRIFFGVILLANGLAKLEPSLGRIDLGPYHANLVTRDGARSILSFEVNEREVRGGASPGTQVPGLRPFVNNVVLANWGVFQWVVVGIEIVGGGLLILGLATRGAALVALGQQLFLALVYLSSNRWAFEQPHEYVPLVVLALVPAGRIWGLDGALVRDRPALRRWPF